MLLLAKKVPLPADTQYFRNKTDCMCFALCLYLGRVLALFFVLFFLNPRSVSEKNATKQ